jgi:hypothetical protein
VPATETKAALIFAAAVLTSHSITRSAGQAATQHMNAPAARDNEFFDFAGALLARRRSPKQQIAAI